MLFDLLDIYNLLTSSGDLCLLKNKVKLVARQSYVWGQVMSHNDGDVAYFNDSTSGVCFSLSEIEKYANKLNLEFNNVNYEKYECFLSPSNFYIRKTIDYKLIADFAAIGPHYLPGHAHADNLSFELDLGEFRVIVNSGISKYGLCHERERQRGTSAHNTVLINNQSSSETWAGFRVARRACTELINHKISDEQSIIVGRHNGYRILKSHLTHTRSFITSSRNIEIVDEVSCSEYLSEARFHLHPKVKVKKISFNSFLLTVGLKKAIVKFLGAESIKIEKTTFHPGFNLSEENKVFNILFNIKLVTQVDIL